MHYIWGGGFFFQVNLSYLEQFEMALVLYINGQKLNFNISSQ